MDHTHLKPARSEPFTATSSIKNLFTESMVQTLKSSLKLSSAYSECFAAASFLKSPFTESMIQVLESSKKLTSAYLDSTAASCLKSPLAESVMKTLESSQKLSSVYLESTAASFLKSSFTESMMKTLESSLKLSSAYSEYSSVLKNPFADSMTQVLESVKKMSSYLDSSSEKTIFPDLSSIDKEAWETLDNGDNFSDNDVVTFDEGPIQEWNIPETVAIPAGNKRIRMKTDIFIAILSGIIFPMLFWVSGLIVDLHDAYLKAETESQRLEIEQERNDLIRESNHLFSQYIDILMSTDTSNSSEADEIEKWKESLPKPDSVPTTADLTPDNLQLNHNNSPE